MICLLLIRTLPMALISNLFRSVATDARVHSVAQEQFFYQGSFTDMTGTNDFPATSLSFFCHERWPDMVCDAVLE